MVDLSGPLWREEPSSSSLLLAARANRLQRPEQFEQVRDILARARKEVDELLEQ